VFTPRSVAGSGPTIAGIADEVGSRPRRSARSSTAAATSRPRPEHASRPAWGRIGTAADPADGRSGRGRSTWASTNRLRNGGLPATRHLLELGHRRIAILSGPRGILCSQAWLAGFRSAHEQIGAAVDPELVRQGALRVDDGDGHATACSRAAPSTAIFAGSDMQAMGVLRAAQRLGLDVPADLSVIGCDNPRIALWTDPALTTIDRPLREMAGTATRTRSTSPAGRFRPRAGSTWPRMRPSPAGCGWPVSRQISWRRRPVRMTGLASWR
jgi:hypothetical protein